MTDVAQYLAAEGIEVKPQRFWRNARFGRDGRISADLNGCLTHRNVCDLILWPDGQEECMICARERQPEASMSNPAFHLRPFWEWQPPRIIAALGRAGE